MQNQIDLNPQRSSSKLILLILVISIILSLTAIQGVSAQEQGPVYIVQPGDTLYSIALHFGTSIELIAAANNISDPYIISPGLRLIIPGFEGVSGVLDLRQIQFGETLESLSSRYGTSTNAIVRLNHVLNPDRLFIGQSAILSIPEGEVPQESLFISELDETALSFSIKNNLNPWKLHDLEEPIDRLWILPAESLAIGVGGDYVTSGLPLPIKSVHIEPERALQGRTVVVRVDLWSTTDVAGSIGDRELRFHTSQAQERVALQGIHALLEPGMYDLILSFSTNETSEQINFVQPLRVASGDYYFDPVLYVPPETIDPQYTQPENEFISSLVNKHSEEKFWEDVFQFPSTSTSVFPSVFGSRRNYNDTGYTSYHTGLDFYGGTGTPIYSPANGVVVFSGPLDVRGNVTFIDHGWGVFTGYLHQSEMLVSAGDWVDVGDEIGKVGSSGRVTGPHLHWEVWVGGVPVDPLEWTSETFPTMGQQPDS
jgi:murein DD-endopeptidase MepM/ murein hydrolase activator NlpD